MTEKTLLKLAVLQGWRLARQGRHTQLRCSCGSHIVTIACSVSDHRALKNCLSELRKCSTWNRDLERA